MHSGSEYQAEVGLLSRNILIQSHNDGTLVGAHFHLMGRINRLSGVLQQRMVRGGNSNASGGS